MSPKNCNLLFKAASLIILGGINIIFFKILFIVTK